MYSSMDGIALKEVGNTPPCSEWVRDGTRLLTGREFINAVKLRHDALPNLTRTKRGRQETVTCRAGCQTEESLGHIWQRCHRTHHTRIQRHDNMLNYVVDRLQEFEYNVERERDIRTQQAVYIPDGIARKGEDVYILDVQVVGLRTPLTRAHAVKSKKYSTPDLLAEVSPSETPMVSSVTLSYRGCWAKESVQTL